MWENEAATSHLKAYIKIISSCILCVKQTNKTWEVNTDEYLHDIRGGQDFLNRTLKALSMKEETDKLKLRILSKVIMNMEKKEHSVGEEICNTSNQ